MSTSWMLSVSSFNIDSPLDGRGIPEVAWSCVLYDFGIYNCDRFMSQLVPTEM